MYFIISSARKGNKSGILVEKSLLLKAGAALVPSTLQRCRSNRDFRAVRAEISVLSRMKSLHSLEISAGSGCSVCRAKRGSRSSTVFEASSLFWVLALAATCWCPLFWEPARCAACELPKARFNANQQQKIARAHPSGAFKEGKVWFAKNVKNSNWMTKSCGQGTADEPGMEEVQNIRRKIPEKDF